MFVVLQATREYHADSYYLIWGLTSPGIAKSAINGWLTDECMDLWEDPVGLDTIFDHHMSAFLTIRHEA